MSGGDRYELVSLYDSRIIERDLTYAEAEEWATVINRKTEHGCRIKRQGDR